MVKYFIDTNIFLRVVAKEDEKTFEECFRLFEKIKRNKIEAVTSKIVLAEIAWTLSSFYKFSKEKVVEALESISKTGGLVIVNDGDTRLAIELYKNHSVKFADCVIASLEEIQTGKWIIISYDKDFDKLKVLRKEPKNILEQLN